MTWYLWSPSVSERRFGDGRLGAAADALKLVDREAQRGCGKEQAFDQARVAERGQHFHNYQISGSSSWSSPNSRGQA